MITEQSLKDEPKKKTILERLSSRQGMLVVGIVSLVFLLAAVSGVWYFLAKRPAPPTLKEPPSSINELVTQFPELSNVLQDEKLNSVYKQFLIAYQEGGIEAALEMAKQRGILNADNEVRLTLELDTTDTSALQASLAAHGIKITAASDNLVDIAIPLQVVEASLASGSPGDIFEKISDLEHIRRILLPEIGQGDGEPLSTNIESLSVINATAWHQAGLTGKGVKIGILDVGFDGYKKLLGSALPEKVLARSFVAGIEIDKIGENHGTAVAEIIHAIAPDADLVLTAYDTSTEMRQAVDWLVSEGVDVISNSTNYVHGPNDGSGGKAKMVEKVVKQGVLWVNSTGNYRLEHYRSQFQDSDGDGWHEFAANDEEMTIYPWGGAGLTLFWDDWDNPTQDFDLYVYDSKDQEIASSTEPQNGSETFPVEAIYYDFPDEGPYYVSIYARNANRSVTFNFFLRHGEIEYTTASHSIGTPADSRSSLSVGAVDWKTDKIKDYSSQGPSEDGRIVPEISAPTDVKSVSYGEPFGGTSAACPHVSGAAGLVLQAFPNYTPQQVTEFLFSSAIDLGENGPDYDYGNGRLWLGDPPDPNAILPTPIPKSSPSPRPTKTVTRSAIATQKSTAIQPSTARPTSTMASAKQAESSFPMSTLIILAFILVPGFLGIAGIGLLGMIWYRNRAASVSTPVVKRSPRMVAPLPPTPVSPSRVKVNLCPQCGKPYQPGERACSGCGQALIAAAAAPAPVEPPRARVNICPHCGKPYRSGERVCSGCGQALVSAAAPPATSNGATLCAQCGGSLRPGAKFCPQCGRKVKSR